MFTIKITKINNMCKYPTGKIGYTAIHFRVNGECYFLWTGAPEYTAYTELFKGRNKGHLESISKCYGYNYDLIRFTKKPLCLKYVDTEHFVKQLKELGLWKGELELL